MAGSSSIFSSDSAGELRGLSRGARLRAAAVLLAALAVLVASVHLLRVKLPPARWGDAQTRVLFVGTSHFDGGVALPRLPWPSGLLFHAGAEQQLLCAALLAHLARWPRLELVLFELDEVSLLGDRAWDRRADLGPLAGELDLDAWELPAKGDALRRSLRFGGGLLRGRGWAVLEPERRLTLARIEALLAAPAARPWSRDQSPYPAPTRTSTLSVELSRRGVDYLQANAADPRYSIEALAQAVRVLRQAGVQVVLLTTPNHRYYRELRPPRFDQVLAEARAAVDRAAGEPVPHWDHRAQPELPDEDFNNATHLNAHGAARFTHRLAEEILAAGLLR